MLTPLHVLLIGLFRLNSVRLDETLLITYSCSSSSKWQGDTSVVLNLFGVKEPQIDPYRIRCSLWDPHLIICSFSMSVYTVDWKKPINSH